MHIFRLAGIGKEPGLSCAFFGRGDVGRPDPSQLARHLSADGRQAPRVVTARQIHSARVLIVEAGDTGPKGDGDALVTASPAVALGIATADCVPIVVFEPGVPALGVVHAGWRGTLAGVLPAAIGEMKRRFGAAPRRMRVGTGPAVRRCCYRVGAEVRDEFRRCHPSSAAAILHEIAGEEGPAAPAMLDLIEANRLQAVDAGVDPGNFESLDVCTVCRPDVCHSYRRDGKEAGRMWLLAALSPPSS